MRIVFDQGTPAPLAKYLTTHEVRTAYELGWSALKNGELISTAEADGFGLLVTTDQNLRYQQNLSQRNIAILVLSTTAWPRILQVIESVVASVDAMKPGGYSEISIPFLSRK